MYVEGKLRIGMGEAPVEMLPNMANRHGLVAGATGTGKTVTVKTIIQSMSDAGIPTFVADVKGDVSGIAVAGEASEKLVARLAALGIENYDFHACPVSFWDVFGEGGAPVRTTVTEMGPVLIARLLDLNEVQQGVLNIVFHIADDQGMLLLDLKDLRSMLAYVSEHASDYTATYGNVTGQTIGAIQRALLQLEDAGGDVFFGEPALNIADWIRTDSDGKGVVNILDCVKLAQQPLLYSTFLLWMLTELYELLPEAGDLDKPKICFFFDEAHLLFNSAPAALLEKVEQVVKLIRSKGVGVYFITQNPSDISSAVLAQLGNRVQHALRAYTPAELKSIKAAAESFRENPAFDTQQAITELATGEALISFLDEDGRPAIVQRAKVIAPACSMGAAPDADKRYLIDNSEFKMKYGTLVDRESAYEVLAGKAVEAAAEAERLAAEEAQRKLDEEEAKRAEKEAEAAAKRAEREAAAEQRRAEREAAAAERKAEREAEAQRKAERKAAEQNERLIKNVAAAALTSVSRSLGTGLARNLLGALKKGLK